MKHLLISFLLITIAFSSLRGSNKQNKHQQENSNSYSESQSENSNYSYDSSDYNNYSYESSDEESYSNSQDSYSNSDSFDYDDFSYSSNDESDNSENINTRRPKPDQDFHRQVFKTLKQIEKGILQDWRSTEDPVLKNQIRALLIQNLENLLPIAQNSIESVEIQTVSTLLTQSNNEEHPKPPHPRPPQPEDEFANQVFETLHQISQVILEQWNVEQDVDIKNQLRENILEQLGSLLPQNE